MNKYQQLIEPKFKEIRSCLIGGETEESLAIRLGISPRSWRRYRHEYPEFNQLILEARKAIDSIVESALLKRAIGFESPEGKSIPPDVRAAMFWLKNRRPKLWRDRHELAVNSPMPVELISEETNL